VLLVCDEIDSLLKGWQHVLDLGPYYWGTQVFWYVASVIGIRAESVRVQGTLAVISLLLFFGGMFNALASV
jgi:hypothetical protein